MPDEAEGLKARLYALLPRVRITDLLVEVAGWSGFADRFTHARSGDTATDQSALMAPSSPTRPTSGSAAWWKARAG